MFSSTMGRASNRDAMGRTMNSCDPHFADTIRETKSIRLRRREYRTGMVFGFCLGMITMCLIIEPLPDNSFRASETNVSNCVVRIPKAA